MASNEPWASAKDHHSLNTEGHCDHHNKENHEFPLTGQSSIYSLTHDEIQNPICDPGRTFGSMSTDEFLSSICFANEGSHPPTTAETASIAAFTTPTIEQPPLQQQDSLSTPDSVSWKTVDEVWDEMPDEQSLPHPQHSGNAGSSSQQHAIGERSLEDFLVRVGTVCEGKPTPPSMGQGGSLMSPMLLDSQMVGQLDMCLGSHNGGKEMDEVKVGRRRRAVLDGPEKIERLHKRMIKNRESAARSRARKQAYTMELEVEVDRLKEENARLREEKWQVKQTIEELMDKRATENTVKPHKTHRRCISFSASS